MLIKGMTLRKNSHQKSSKASPNIIEFFLFSWATTLYSPWDHEVASTRWYNSVCCDGWHWNGCEHRLEWNYVIRKSSQNHSSFHQCQLSSKKTFRIQRNGNKFLKITSEFLIHWHKVKNLWCRKTFPYEIEKMEMTGWVRRKNALYTQPTNVVICHDS